MLTCSMEQKREAREILKQLLVSIYREGGRDSLLVFAQEIGRLLRKFNAITGRSATSGAGT